MMGDDMAIRSGGMYGNPESAYTVAKPISNFGSMRGGLTFAGRFGKAALNLSGTILDYQATSKQIAQDLETLRREKEYNVKNFQQRIADTFAMNKASFYASGLDFSGTAKAVTLANKQALSEDLQITIANYGAQEKTLRAKQSANMRNLWGGVADSIISMF
jgi:hypothetical protein